MYESAAEEFVEIDEIIKDISPSQNTSMAIKEVSPEEESSDENGIKNTRLLNFKQPQVSYVRNHNLDLLDYLPQASMTDEKVPNSTDIINHKFDQYKTNVKNKSRHNKIDSYFNEEDKYEFSTIDKPTTVSPETYHLSTGFNKKNSETYDQISNFKPDILKGDEDSMSQINNTNTVSIFTYVNLRNNCKFDYL